MGDTFVLVNNEGSGPVNGTFNGLPEGVVLNLGGSYFRLSYAGGDGNDVVLTRVFGGTGSLTVTVFRDYNADGVPQAGEYGLAGLTVYLDLNGNGQFDAGEPTAVTDAAGHATFAGLGAGTFLVRQDLSHTPGVALTAGADAGVSVPLAGGGSASAALGDLLYSPAAPVAPLASIYGSGNADANTAYVGGLYRSMLGREPDSGGLAYWLAQLGGGATRLQVVQGFFNSPEHRGQEVDVYYQTFLHRAADPAGRAYWVGLFLGGADEAAVLQGFLTSGEFQAEHADPNLFVQDLYLDLLGRTPDAMGQAYWLGLLGGGVSRANVVAGFIRSAEVAARAVDGFYAAYLHRPSDPAGAYWLGLWTGGVVRLTDIAAGYLTSDEFYHNGAATVG